jgi:hypothetical protein
MKLVCSPKLLEQCFETVTDIQRELQVVLNSIKKNYFHGALKDGKTMGSLYMFPRLF